MGNKVCLNIETNNGIITIPFKGIKELDLYTVGYENEEELIDSLNKILDLSIYMEDIISIYISSSRYINIIKNIKYSKDNYNLDSLKQTLSLYLRQDHKRLRHCDVRFVNTSGMVRFQAGMPIDDYDIDLAVKIFLNRDYKKQRDMYFMIKDFASIKIDKLSKNKTYKRDELSKLESHNDDFFQYLIELAGRDEESLERAIDELSKFDLEEISRALGKNQRGIIDGVSDAETVPLEDIYALEGLTGISIEELKELQFGYRNSGLRR